MSYNRHKLWIVSELFFPDETSTSYILTKIANKLCDKYDVNVISTSLLYDKSSRNNSLSFLLNDSISIHRVFGLNLNKNYLIFRLIRLVTLSFTLFFALIKKLKTGEKVLIVTNPAPLLMLISFLRIFKTFDFIILVHDVFPENTIPAGIIKSPKNFLYKLLKFFFDKAYSKANILIVLGRDMKDIIEKKLKGISSKNNIIIIENWADTINITPHERNHEKRFIHKIVFQYAGNLGRVQGLLHLLELIKSIENTEICFFFIGEGALKPEMIEYVTQNKIENVFFRGNYSRGEQNSILNDCDIAIVTLASGMYGLGVPSKTYNILAAGKPILFIGSRESEIGRLIEENGNGFCFESVENCELYDFLKNLKIKDLADLKKKGEISRLLAETKYAEDIILNKFDDTI